MPNGVSGDWETMLSRACIFLTIGRQLAKATTTAADHAPDGTSEERSQIAQHVAAVYRILRAATVRRGEIGEFPLLGLGPATPNDSQAQRLERLQNGTRQFRHTFRRYRRQRKLTSNASKITHKKSQAPTVHRRLAGVRHRLGRSLAGTPNAVGGPVGNSACSQGRL